MAGRSRDQHRLSCSRILMNVRLVPTAKMKHNSFSQVISPEWLAFHRYTLHRIVHPETYPPGTQASLLGETAVCSTVLMILNR